MTRAQHSPRGPPRSSGAPPSRARCYAPRQPPPTAPTPTRHHLGAALRPTARCRAVGGASALIARQRPLAARARCAAARSLTEPVACKARARGPVSGRFRRIERQCARGLRRGGGAGKGGVRVGVDLRSPNAPAVAAPPPGRSSSPTPQARRAPCSGRSSERQQPSCATRNKDTCQQGQQVCSCSGWEAVPGAGLLGVCIGW